MRFAELSTLLLFLGLGLASNEAPYKVKCGVSGVSDADNAKFTDCKKLLEDPTFWNQTAINPQLRVTDLVASYGECSVFSKFQKDEDNDSTYLTIRNAALQLLGCANQGEDKINAKGYWEFDEPSQDEVSKTVRQSVCIAKSDKCWGKIKW